MPVTVRLADRLAAARRRGFVGRDEQLARFRRLLVEPDSERVVFVHGPGGVGKTALLHQFAWLAEQRQRHCVWLDGRELPPDEVAVRSALQAALNTSEDPLLALEHHPDLLLLIDTLEALRPLDRWLRTELIPRLRAEALTVLSGRDRPAAEWRADQGWRELLVTMSLTNLDPETGRSLLAARGFPGANNRKPQRTNPQPDHVQADGARASDVRASDAGADGARAGGARAGGTEAGGTEAGGARASDVGPSDARVGGAQAGGARADGTGAGGAWASDVGASDARAGGAGIGGARASGVRASDARVGGGLAGDAWAGGAGGGGAQASDVGASDAGADRVRVGGARTGDARAGGARASDVGAGDGRAGGAGDSDAAADDGRADDLQAGGGWGGDGRGAALQAGGVGAGREEGLGGSVVGVEEGVGDVEAVLAFTRGHPLALALVADVAAQRAFVPAEAPEVIATLLRSFVDTVPSAEHRAALEASAQVLGLTEPLLAAMLGRPSATDLFAWLRELSIVEQGERGLYPHDLVRDVIATEARWRDPDGYDEARRRAAAYYRAQFDRASPEARQRFLLDFAYLHRESSVLAPFLGAVSPETQRLRTTKATDEDHLVLRSWVLQNEGPDSERIFDHWWARQPSNIRVVRDNDGNPTGFFHLVHLEDTEAVDRRIDPALAALPREQQPETSRLVRFWMTRDDYQGINEVQAHLTLEFSRAYLTTPMLAWTFLVFRDPDFWADGCAHLDYHRLPEADFVTDGHRYGVYGHDWRVVPPLAWLSLLADRETRPSADNETKLDRQAFEAAVREALRGLGRAGGLRGSALLTTRLVDQNADEQTRLLQLRTAFEECSALLEASPRDLRGFRALHHTYFRPAGTQHLAAELLNLPTTTYRRHLATGIDRLTELLWQRASP